MNRKKVLEEILKIVVLRHYAPSINIAVLLPTFDEVKRFRKDIQQTYDELPPWLRPTPERDTIRQLEFDHCRIILIHSVKEFHGRTLDIIYAASNLPSSTRYEFEEECIIHHLRGSTSRMETFENI